MTRIIGRVMEAIEVRRCRGQCLRCQSEQFNTQLSAGSGESAESAILNLSLSLEGIFHRISQQLKAPTRNLADGRLLPTDQIPAIPDDTQVSYRMKARRVAIGIL
jgi:hypothetical protein